MNNYSQGKNTKVKSNSNSNRTNNNSIFNKSFSNTMTNNNTKFPYMKVNILYVIIGVLLIVTSYMLFRYFRTLYVDSKIDFIQSKLSGNKNARDTMIIPYDLTPVSMYGNEYNISFWLMVNDLSYGLGKKKIILTKGPLIIYIDEKMNHMHIAINDAANNLIESDNNTETNTETNINTNILDTNETSSTTLEQDSNTENFISYISDNPIIHKQSYKQTELIEKNNYLDPIIKHNKLLDLVANDNYDTPYSLYKENFNSKDNNGLYECSIYNIPIQRWTHYSINIVDNIVEVYIDGKLDASCKIDVISKINTASLILNPDGGLSGELSNIYYSNIRLSTRQVQKLYNMGP